MSQQRRYKLGALNWLAGYLLAIDADNTEPAGGRGQRRGCARRPEADDGDIASEGHAAHAAARLLAGVPPSLMEQHECACSKVRPTKSATATAPSAGKAMPSRPAITA